MEVIGVAEDDLRAGPFDLGRVEPSDGSERPDRHEGGGAHRTVRETQMTGSGAAIGLFQRERNGHRPRIRSSWRRWTRSWPALRRMIISTDSGPRSEWMPYRPRDAGSSRR